MIGNHPSDKKVYINYISERVDVMWGFYSRPYNAWKYAWKQIERSLLNKLSS
jgi:hypothetical protein